MSVVPRSSHITLNSPEYLLTNQETKYCGTLIFHHIHSVNICPRRNIFAIMYKVGNLIPKKLLDAQRSQEVSGQQNPFGKGPNNLIYRRYLKETVQDI